MDDKRFLLIGKEGRAGGEKGSKLYKASPRKGDTTWNGRFLALSQMTIARWLG
jgi:hypothetical protein